MPLSPTDNPLRVLTHPGTLYERLPDDRVRCYACGHRCLIAPDQWGVCRVRFNDAGTLRVPWGYVGAVQIDPIEKKPFFHALPGVQALSFGMLGCDFHCGYCQNWVNSQALRDPRSNLDAQEISVDEIVQLALARRTPVITSTYNEPLITSEWSMAIFAEAKKQGLVTSYVSNGNATPEVLQALRPFVDLYKVDLKSFRDAHYRRLGGVLQNVLDSIAEIHRLGFWLEIVTLIIPDFNDSKEELTDIATFLRTVSPDIPWHVTAFHPDYKMTDRGGTLVSKLIEACEIGEKAGLRYVYGGNLPGRVGSWEHTRCPSCHAVVIEREGYRILSNRVREGACFACGEKISGFWTMPT
jgi:pyruvate formate lyase activating enzyme